MASVTLFFSCIPSGVAGMAYDVACKAMLDGMESAIEKMKPNSLSLIRIVIMEQPVFQAFRFEADFLHSTRVCCDIRVSFSRSCFKRPAL